MADICIYDKITFTDMTPDFIHTIDEDASSSPTSPADGSDESSIDQNVVTIDYTVEANTATSANSTDFCTVTSTLEIFDEETDDWWNWDPAVSGNTTDYPWIDTNDFQLDNYARRIIVNTDPLTDPDVTYVRPITYKLRWKAEDADSEQEEGVVYDYFDITIQYGCTADTVVLTNSGDGRNTPFVYTIGDTSGTTNNFAKTTTHGHTSDDCPISMDCQYWDESAGSWLT